MFLTSLPMAPRDPILGLNEQFAHDPRPEKVNLAVGVYHDDGGRIPLLECIANAEADLVAARLPRGYQPIDGTVAFQHAVLPIVFGIDADSALARRVATVQTVGGTSALRLGAEFARRWGAPARALISEPTWENHRGVLSRAGYQVHTYRYLPRDAEQPDLSGMLTDLSHASAGTVVVLHACCHNPTGYDLPQDAWPAIIDIIAQRRLIPLIDMAYQGFGDGLDADARVARAFVEAGLPCMVATSFSKNFSLYGERVGALSVVCPTEDVAVRVRSQLKLLIRTNYSNPPSHGGRLVTQVLTTPLLREHWQAELEAIRLRICRMRTELSEALKARGVDKDFAFIERQKGMFSYSGLKQAQMEYLREECAIYGADSGRICIAALNSQNLARVADALAAAFRLNLAASRS
ncbi:Aminotransferase [Cupriavidus necator]|uniref:Aminotransferase n=1 Tax=Cupriavidus necator (strain ATCC 17699 / DSM 428 / KCTC 22496 / NCIMB 10442 / H16 / Stanier 337) TaxID=381666 RepID=Q0KBJ4_CUPNH|nr:amino acid aminotransferase [Cupriavidus necator]QCC00506.1 aspartate/tyrosine/aromatic aminotransferase [Cupriavidus necator H16]QQB76676.1 aspartate/tyrosine/aromatic aminotransferase [Cupriavidus necator]WKA42368.1 amino acid aminotransferase [Cupriavidus necator]CAJ92627.1 Aspartate/tyrosine/aromatic aminotransferase [Cupriavidus necator H16]